MKNSQKPSYKMDLIERINELIFVRKAQKMGSSMTLFVQNLTYTEKVNLLDCLQNCYGEFTAIHYFHNELILQGYTGDFVYEIIE